MGDSAQPLAGGEEAELLDIFLKHPSAAHDTLFAHRHSHARPAFHREMIDAFHSAHPRVELMAFRGAAKSTLAEETITIRALFRLHKNFIIVGENEDRAKERLRSIKHELESNELIQFIFGPQKGDIWAETKICLANGVIIQAYGRGQSLRGAKHLDMRPDFVFCDDLEDQDSILTVESRKKTNDWFWQVLVPALDNPVSSPIRLAATPLHDEALAVNLAKLSEWRCITVPIESLDPETGERQSSWPAKFPLSAVDTMKASFYNSGNADLYTQEYMCEVSDVAKKIFQRSMFRFEPMVRTYQAVYAAYDPARTVKNTSATTGKVVCSWVGNRLIVWEATGKLWKPDEIIEDMFDVDARYSPVAIGVEEDGLHEFIMQPLRAAQVQRGRPLPLRPLKAPKGKVDFIRSLQPYFNAREVIFAGAEMDFQDLVGQLLNFGHASAKIDVPNALAYMLKMRPGKPIYDNFTHENILEEIPVARAPGYCLVNSDGSHTGYLIAQMVEGRCNILADGIREGEPGAGLEGILEHARRVLQGSGYPVVLVAPPDHWKVHDNIGLRAAAVACAGDLRRGGDPTKGREMVRERLQRRDRGLPQITVTAESSWCLRAFTGGYCRALLRDGTLGSEPSEGAYSLLMRALESFMAMSEALAEDTGLKYDLSRDGRRFLSARS